MSGDAELDDMLALPSDELVPEETLVSAAPKSRPMGEASRALLERSRSFPVNRAAKKNTPERLRRLLDYIAELPVTSDACVRANISTSTLKYWLQKSLEGKLGDGFDIPMGENDENGTDENFIRFHDAWEAAMECGVGLVEKSVLQRATGYSEPLTYQGRVQYRFDPELLAAARADGKPEYVPENYLLDRFGSPVPESVWKMDPDLAMFILKTRKPLVYGAKATLDVNVRGGVLVVPMRALAPEDLNVIEQQDRARGRKTITFDEGDEDATDV
jgi:hypothetical protein